MMDRHVDHLVIGGGIAGVTAAETIRERDARASILVLGDEPEMTYSRVMLPHVVRGKTPEARTFLRTREGLAAKRIGFEAGVRVTRVDAGAREVHLANGSVVTFGKLLIATGGRAHAFDVPGGDDPSCLSFQTIEDARTLIAHRGDKRAVVVGGGFIALELLMSFAAFGAETVSVVRGTGFFGRALGSVGQSRIDAVLAANGVVRRYGETVREIVRDDAGLVARLGSGIEERADAVGLGIGIERNVDLLAKEGAIAIKDGIVVDERLETSVPGIFAAGDVASSFDARVGRHRAAGNWQNAVFQGKVAGANMAGDDVRYTTLTSYAITCFGLPILFSGATDGKGERIVRETPEALIEWHVENGRVTGAVTVGPSTERAAVQRILTLAPEITDALRTALEDPSRAL